MAFRITFFRMPNPRRFTYTPIYYDPIKERIEEARARVAKEEEEKAHVNERRNYAPGQIVRGSFQRSFDERRRPSGNSTLIRVVIYLTVIVLFLFFYFFTDGMSLLFRGLHHSTP